MTSWRFSDGTTVELGGNVEGASLFAQELRYDLAQPFVGVQTAPIPHPGVELDVKDPTLLDTWLRFELARPFRRDRGITLVEAPDVPPLPEHPVQDNEDPGDPPEDLVY